MSSLAKLLEKHVGHGAIPGGVALVAHGDDVEVAAAGSLDVEGSAPMAEDSVFRIASVTKPMIAAAAMMLVDDGSIGLDEPISKWIPELATPMVVRSPSSPIEDVVPADREITLADLQTSRSGYGFPDDFSLPAVQPLFSVLGQGPMAPTLSEAEWTTALAGIPMLAQPGRRWLYNTSSDILGVLIARVSGRTLGDFLAERLFGPLGMRDTAFWVLPAKQARLSTAYSPGEDGLVVSDGPGAAWSSPPIFESGAGGLVSTVPDLLAFARLFVQGAEPAAQSILSPDSTRAMTMDHLTAQQRLDSEPFLEGQGWGFGGSVDVVERDQWNVPGRYGWVGGSGTALHVVASTGLVSILLTQVAMTGPTPPDVMREFWAYAARSA